MRKVLAIAFLVLAFGVSFAAADVKLPNVLSDNMVLQQGKKITIWGWAEVGEKVAVTLGADKADTAAGKDGKWQVEFAPRKASREPVELTVAGKNTLTVKGILIGEVWVCSGQSNMQWEVRLVNNAAEELKNADYPQIRLLPVKWIKAGEPQDDQGNRWVVCSPNYVVNFSAVGFLFGRNLHKELDVPVGLISPVWGGSPIEAWTPMDTVKTDPELKDLLANVEKESAGDASAKANYAAKLEAWEKLVKAVRETQPSVSDKNLPKKPQEPNTTDVKYGGMYNAMVAPFTKLSIAGVIWYQGEANVRQPALYARQFPAMIRGWRTAFNNDEFPFLYVQLTSYNAGKDPKEANTWSALRESQNAALTLPKTGFAVTLDVGNPQNIHPTDKQTVAKRLTLAAMAIAYGKNDVAWQGPTFESMKAGGAKLVVKFTNTAGGLVSKPVSVPGAKPDAAPAAQFDSASVLGFEIAGADGKYATADAKIDGDTVVLTAQEVSAPVAVRYAWTDCPMPNCTLYNKADLPAGTFRAGEDKFSPTTQPAK